MKQKRNDIILITVIFVIAALAIGAIFVMRQSGEVVKITLDNEVYGTYDLDKDEVIQIDTEYGSNTVTIKDGTVAVTEADCPDQICVHEYPLGDDSPNPIVCLPHKLIVEIQQK